ncbi:MAG: oligosaccharide flippase family protein, partial [Clostridia bacterium]|nr:oligosaccharide flippase family protein [Clostridia bacterium]
MKIERTANAKRNIVAGFAFKMVAMFGPFIMRTVLFYTMGVEYVGLNSLFTAILSFLALSELGIGSAMVYAMYKPIANDDADAICALLNLYRKLYRIIGVVILVLGMILFPFIPHLVNGEVPPDINLYVLYAFYLLNTVLSYFLYGYKQSLLLAHQRNDIISVRALIVRVLMYTAQIVVLYVTKNYYLYVIMFLAYTVITNIANSVIVDKMYPEYVCKGKVPKADCEAIKTNVLSLVGGKLSTIMLNFSDNLMISMFFGLAMVARFDNYYYIVSMLVGFFAIVYEALTGGLGNSIQLDTVEKNHSDFKVLSFINFWLVSWSSICIMCIIQPFIHVWVGKDLMFSNGIAVLFALYLYVMQSEKIVLTYKDAAG